jgi:hypothetical protein
MPGMIRFRRHVEIFTIDRDANRRFGRPLYRARTPWHSGSSDQFQAIVRYGARS